MKDAISKWLYINILLKIIDEATTLLAIYNSTNVEINPLTKNMI